MSTSSEKQTPEAQIDSANEAGVASWESFSLRVSESSRDDFESWLEQQLDEMETALDAFANQRAKIQSR